MSHNFAAVYVNTEEEEPPKFVCIVNQVSLVSRQLVSRQYYLYIYI